jgi:hypothetical protein
MAEQAEPALMLEKPSAQGSMPATSKGAVFTITLNFACLAPKNRWSGDCSRGIAPNPQHADPAHYRAY